MTPESFRRLALSFPEARESSHQDHPDFRVRGKIFATLGYPDETWAMVKLTPAQQLSFIQFDAAFVPVPGYWGKHGSTHVRLKSAKTPAVRRALSAAWHNVAPRRLQKSTP